MIKPCTLLLLISISLYAFEDDDIDGVENSKDLCPETSFDETVDEQGCPEHQTHWGKLTFTLGSDINRDETTTTDYNFFTNYSYHAGDVSLYSSQQGVVDQNSDKSQSTGDLYLSSGYGFSKESLYSKLSLGVKIPTGGSEVSTEEYDYFATLNLSYAVGEKMALFSSLSYTNTGDNNETTYRNPLSYSLGVGYMLSEKWYSSLSYQSSNSIYEDGEDYQSLSLYNSYNSSEKLFGSLSYTKGIDELSYDETISLRLGVRFE